jgi:uncharacterized protein (TIGR03067 family)
MTRRLVIVSVALIAMGFAFFTANNTAHTQPPPPPFPTPVVVAQGPGTLDGTWELVSVIDDGKLISLDHVKQSMLKDARIVIRGQTASVLRPDGKVRSMAFVTDPTASPKTVDIAGDLHIGGKGIYMRDADVLMICTHGADSNKRPSVMASLPGSDNFLMTFRRLNVPVPHAVVEFKPPPPPVVIPHEDVIRKTLIGTWGHQTDSEIVKVTMNTDGTFALLRSYKKGFKKVFDHEDRTSGTWRLKDGEVSLSVVASTIRENNGQVFSYRITSINDSELIYVDTMSGQRRVEWKLR